VLDRALATKLAVSVAGGDALPTQLPGDLAAMCADARERVCAYARLEPAAPLPPPEAVDREAWIAANVASMGQMLDPVTERVGEGMGFARGPARAAAGMLLSAEAGALTGYLAQRVLGQYELVLLDPDSVPRLLFVAPNVLETARTLDVDAEQLLAWIAFHEVTHAVQFSAVAWLRPHLAGLLGELLATLEVRVDASALLRLPSGDDVRGLVDRVRDGGLAAAVAGPERQAILDRLQVVMAVVEGHAEHVMDAVGAQTLPDLGGLREALDRRRRERPPLLKLLERLIGLDLKLRQYEVGKRFCDAVAAADGADGLRRVWAAPEALPSPAELEDPDAWLSRTRVPRVTT
jgi:coenzyme F420 biosynthesis associated uncharacterized protein